MQSYNVSNNLEKEEGYFNISELSMTFPNAFAGVKKVFLAQILSIISMGCTLIGGLVGGVSIVGGSAAGVGGGAFLVIAALILSLLALIFNMIGLSVASRDEDSFKNAFYCTLVNLIVSIVFAIIGAFAGGIWTSISTIITTALGIAVLIYVFRGIGNLAVRLGRDDVPRFGKPVLILLVIVNAVTIFVTLMNLINTSYSFYRFLSVLSTIAAIADIVGIILYLIYLSRAKNMLQA